MKPLLQRLYANVQRHALWGPGECVHVAVSGGRDSVVLLDALVATRGMHRAELAVATVDHGIRENSAQDAEFVRELALRHGLPFFHFALKLGREASEEQAREARYRVLRPLGKVAVAHHAPDHAEPLLIQLLRGAGGAGLAGMGWENQGLVRPLLDIEPELLEEWAAFRALSWREDETNRDPRFLRSVVRHQLIPTLDELRTGSTRAIARTASRLAEDEDFFREYLKRFDANRWSREDFGRLPPAITLRLLLRAFPAATGDWARGALDQLRTGSRWIPAPGGGGLQLDREVILVVPKELVSKEQNQIISP